jgi:hypothetical protein
MSNVLTRLHRPLNTVEKIAIMRAWLDGKQIERKHGDQWIPQNPNDGRCLEPCWNWEHCEYRIKPEPMEIEVWIHDDGSVALGGSRPAPWWTKKKFREVTE